MRIVLDLQACQSSSKYRGIGRYALSFAKALIPKLVDRNHEVIIALSNSFPSEADEIGFNLSEYSSTIKIYRFSILSSSKAKDPQNQWRQMASRTLREHALAKLCPDVLLVATLLADGWEDDTVASVGMINQSVPTALIHYDLIPFVMPDIYLSEPKFKKYYLEKLESVSRVDLLLAISEYSKKEAEEYLSKDANSVVNISSAVNSDFATNGVHIKDASKVLLKFNLDQNFLLYAPGGFDPRKNLDRLLEAYSLLSQEMRSIHKLVIASKLPEGFAEGVVWKAGTYGIEPSQIVLTDYVTDDELAELYKNCIAYIFPSLHEGFGLPVLEAMKCGAAVIASNKTSIPEAHGMHAALFNPYSVEEMANKMQEVIENSEFRVKLKNHAKNQVEKFTWENTADIAIQALEGVAKVKKPHRSLDVISQEYLLNKLSELDMAVKPTVDDLISFKQCFKVNNESIV